MQKLANAADDAKQIIGEGLLDALTGLGEDDSVQNLASSMQNFATETANVIRGIGKLIEKIQALDDKVPDWLKFDVGMVPIVGSWYKIASAAGTIAGVQKASDNQHLQSLQQQYKIDTKISKISTKLTADQLKKLKAKKLEQAIDKANLALNKGEEVFDMDKIQIAAALTNQAEQLGKATSSAQVLQIANDTARLNVKQSILALEDAIASKDEAAITAATKKLNEDLKILGVLSGQNVKLQDIKSILDSLKPKDLINLANLDAAIAKMLELLRLQGTSTLVPTTPSTVSPVVTGNNAAVDSLIDLRKTTESGTAINFLLKEHIDEIIADSSSSMVDEQSQLAMMRILGRTGITADSTFDPARFRARESGDVINVTVQAGVGDPNAIAEAIDEFLRQARDRGTLTAL
jgi:hypothetical protein